MIVLYLMTVLAISACNAEEQVCGYTLTENSTINGGTLAPAIGLGACQAYCTSRADCQSFDFDPGPTSNECWWLTTQSGLESKPGIQHYDKYCRVRTDVVSNPGNPQCFKTNYQGPVSDFWSAPKGVTWNYQLAHFGFDWPQTGVDRQPLSTLIFLKEISFNSSDNLDYFRAVITQNNGKTIRTKAIGPNEHSTTLRNANDVKRVDFYLASVDYNRNVSLNDVYLKACTGTGATRECTIFNLVKDQIQAASLGIIRPGGTSGTFSVSVAQEYPFVELDLNCTEIGNVNFAEVIFYGVENFEYVVIAYPGDVTIVPIDIFNNAKDINTVIHVHGNRVPAMIIPSRIPGQGISGFIRFSKYSIIAGE